MLTFAYSGAAGIGGDPLARSSLALAEKSFSTLLFVSNLAAGIRGDSLPRWMAEGESMGIVLHY